MQLPFSKLQQNCINKFNIPNRVQIIFKNRHKPLIINTDKQKKWCPKLYGHHFSLKIWDNNLVTVCSGLPLLR